MSALPEWFDWADIDGNDQPPALPVRSIEQQRRENDEVQANVNVRTCRACGATFRLDPYKGRKRVKCYVCSPPELNADKVQGRTPRKNASVVDNLPFRGEQITPSPKAFDADLASRSNERPDDETALDWWTAFDKGDTPEYIADVWQVTVEVVIRTLDDLGVLLEPRHPVAPTTTDSRGRTIKVQEPSQAKTDDIELDQNLLERAMHDQLDARERRIMEALGRIMGSSTFDDLPPKQSTPAVYSMHRRPYSRSHVPMSRRERKQNAMANTKWRRLVALDMSKLGIMPRHR